MDKELIDKHVCLDISRWIGTKWENLMKLISTSRGTIMQNIICEAISNEGIGITNNHNNRLGYDFALKKSGIRIEHKYSCLGKNGYYSINQIRLDELDKYQYIMLSLVSEFGEKYYIFPSKDIIDSTKFKTSRQHSPNVHAMPIGKDNKNQKYLEATYIGTWEDVVKKLEEIDAK